MSDGRIPPQAIDAEQSILGAVLQHKQALTKATELLEPYHFYVPKHRKIFASILRVKLDGMVPDLITVRQDLTDVGQIDDIGGRRYLMDLTDSVVTFSNIEDHCRLVLEAAKKNKLIDDCMFLIDKCYSPANSEELEGDLQKVHLALKVASKRDSITTPYQIAEEYLQSYDEPHIGLKTGFPRFDYMTNGLEPADLIYIGGWPSVGKTAFVINVALNISVFGEVPSLFISLEMKKPAIMDRITGIVSDVSSLRIKRKTLTDTELHRWTNGVARFSDSKLYISDEQGLTMAQIGNMVRQGILDYGIKAVFIDSAHHIQGKGDTDKVKYSRISGELKILAGETNLPIMAIVKLAKEKENRPPNNSDLRETGDWEYDAFKIFFPHRKHINSGDDEGMRDNNGVGILSKNRDGPTGNIGLTFNPKRASWAETAKENERGPIEDDPGF
jgi:replicative DNA helicase